MLREFTDAKKGFLKILTDAKGKLITFADQIVSPKSIAPVVTFVAPTAQIAKTLVPIPESYEVGELYNMGDWQGWYLGDKYFGDELGEKPLFVVALTKERLTFDQTVAATSKLPNGYVADPRYYDAEQALREGKTVIATGGMIEAVYARRDKGGFKNLFNEVKYMLCSTPHVIDDRPDYSQWLSSFRDGYTWMWMTGMKRPSALVRTGPEPYYEVGKLYDMGDWQGWYLRHEYLGEKLGKKPIFVVGLDPTAAETFKLPTNRYVSDPGYEYDAIQDLREGKTVLATKEMFWIAYHNKNKGGFKKIFGGAVWRIDRQINYISIQGLIRPVVRAGLTP